MSEPFPSKAYQELCTQPEVAEKLREEWEPQEGDWCLSIDGRGPYLVHTVTDDAYYIRDGSYRIRLESTKDFIPLFQPRQIVEMLEERGYKRIIVKIRPGWVEVAIAKGPTYPKKDSEGPDPATALLRAWLSLDPVGDPVGEVEKEE